ncbi:MAG: hypothetical protein ACOC9S_01895, partial [Planctomycetota bacterium]
VVDDEHRLAAQRFRAIYATYLGAEDLINIGALSPGSNQRIDKAVSLIDRVNEFLVQDVGERTEFSETVRWLKDITASWDFLLPGDSQSAKPGATPQSASAGEVRG